MVLAVDGHTVFLLLGGNDSLMCVRCSICDKSVYVCVCEDLCVTASSICRAADLG